MDWLGTDQLVAATNFAKWVCLYAVGWVLAYYIWERYRRGLPFAIVNVALFGAMLEAFGWGLHRQFWWLWRQLRSMGNCADADPLAMDPAYCSWATEFVSHGWITAIASVIILTGTACMASPITHAIFGRWWPAVSLAFIGVVFGTGLAIAVLPHA